MALSPLLKDEFIRLLDDLAPESWAEVREFLEFLKFKAKSTSHSAPVAIDGWLKGYRFSSEDIAQARDEMWARFQDSSA